MTSLAHSNVVPLGPEVCRARDKIATVDDIAALAASFRSQGRRVALAHGVFDLAHMGHVRHLESARLEGDVLIVSITPDRHVNKGPGRQGPDYRNESEDLTGKIGDERAAVERHGGRIVYTDDITFSSSSLLNQHFNVFEPEVQAFLDSIRRSDGLSRALAAIEDISEMWVLLIGEAIIDEYLYAEAMGKAAKENIIASRFCGREVFAGGVIAAANHVAGFCKHVEVITCLGTRDTFESLIREGLKPNVNANFLYRAGTPTTRKTRFVDPAHMRKLFEVYFFEDTPLSGSLEQQLCDMIGDLCGQFDVVIANDFGHGIITDKAIPTATAQAPFLAVNAQTNSGNQGYNLITKYRSADYVCIDGPEARLAVSDRFTPLEDLIEHRLSPAINCDRLVVTDSERGCVAYASDAGAIRVPAFTRQVVDTVGAGDAFLAVTSPVVANGAPMDNRGFDRQRGRGDEGRYRRPPQRRRESPAHEVFNGTPEVIGKQQ